MGLSFFARAWRPALSEISLLVHGLSQVKSRPDCRSGRGVSVLNAIVGVVVRVGIADGARPRQVCEIVDSILRWKCGAEARPRSEATLQFMAGRGGVGGGSARAHGPTFCSLGRSGFSVF